jgi:hypothetical protein
MASGSGSRRLVLRRFPFDVVYLHSHNQNRHCRYSPSAPQPALLAGQDLRIT